MAGTCNVKISLAVLVLCVRLFECDRESRTRPDLPDEPHDKYKDQAKFLRQHNGKEMSKMSPANAKKELARIVHQMDTNHDGFISKDELMKRLKRVQEEYVNQSAAEMWQSQSRYNRSFIMWEDIANSTYAYLNSTSTDTETLKYGKDQMDRDLARFKAADVDKNGQLTWTEYITFVHPETSKKMRDLVLKETMNDMDKNKDGFIDIDEYIADMQSGQSETDVEWINKEKINFRLHRDMNGDGFLDLNELRQMFQPAGYDPFNAEATYLISQSDDGDGKLTEQEIMNRSDLFMTSPIVPDHLRVHDEL